MENQPKKKGLGCFPIGCLTVLIIIIAGIFIGNYVIFHSSWPLKKVVGMIDDSDDNIEIRGITGSIKSGIGIEYLHVIDSQGNTNRLEGLDIGYDSSGGIFQTERFILTHVQIESAEFFIDSTGFSDSGETDSSESGDSEPDVSFDSGSDSQSGTGVEFIIGVIDINNVTFVDPNSGWRGEIGKVHLAGLEVNADGEPKMGALTVESNMLDVSMKPESGDMDSRLVTAVSIKTAIHSNLVKNITFSGTLDLNGLDADSPYTIQGFDGKFQYSSDPATKQGVTRITDLNPNEYIRDWVPVEQLNIHIIETEGDEKQTELKTASLRIGETRFSAEPFVATGKEIDQLDTEGIKTTSANGDVCILRDSINNSISPTMVLTTKNGATGLDALAHLLHGKGLGDCTPEQKAAIETKWKDIVLAPKE